MVENVLLFLFLLASHAVAAATRDSVQEPSAATRAALLRRACPGDQEQEDCEPERSAALTDDSAALAMCERKGTCLWREHDSSIAGISSVGCMLAAGWTRPSYCQDIMLDLLSLVTGKLELAGIEHWITQGTLLGAMRRNDLIPWSNDVDVGFMATDLQAVIRVLETTNTAFSQTSPPICSSNARDRPAFCSDYPYIAVNARGIMGVHLDLNGRRVLPLSNGEDDETGPRLDKCIVSLHGKEACDEPTHPGNMRLKDVLPLSTMWIRGRQFYAPARPIRVLEIYYGLDWRVEDRTGIGKWTDEGDIHSIRDDDPTGGMGPLDSVRSVHRPGSRGGGIRRRVYVGVTADFVLLAHVELFQKAKRLGDELFVGIYNRSVAAARDGHFPANSMNHRAVVVEALRSVDGVIAHAPCTASLAFTARHEIDIVGHNDDALVGGGADGVYTFTSVRSLCAGV